MIPVSFRKSASFPGIGVFAVAFFIVAPASAFAGACSAEQVNQSADFSCTIEYADTGGGGLKYCSYKLVQLDENADGLINEKDLGSGWKDATPVADCKGEVTPPLTANITVGAGKFCDVEGDCKLYAKAYDQLENTSGSALIKTFTIAFPNTAPTLTSIATLTQINASPGAFEDTDFTISYATLAGAADEADADGDPISFRIEAVSTGTLTKGGVAVTPGTTLLASGESVVWISAADANGSALNAFTIKAYDGAKASATAVQVKVDVTAVNDKPSFTKGADQTVAENAVAQTVALWATDIKPGPATALDEATQTVTFTVTNSNNPLFSSQPAIASNGTLTYTPAANTNGNATVTVTAKDNGGTANGGVDASASQTFVITVTAGPIAKAQNATLDEDTTKTITLEGSDGTVCELTFIKVSDPAHGTLSAITDNACNNTVTPKTDTAKIVYTPNANYNGADSFTFKVNNGTQDSNIATVSITVTAINDAPVAKNGTLSVAPGASKSGTLNATDADGDALTFSIVSQGTKGTATITNASTGAYTYAANAGTSGTDTFTFKAADSGGLSSTATITVSIGTNLPVSIWGNARMNKGSVNVPIPMRGFYDGDGNKFGDAMKFTVETQPQHGALNVLSGTKGEQGYALGKANPSTIGLSNGNAVYGYKFRVNKNGKITKLGANFGSNGGTAVVVLKDANWNELTSAYVTPRLDDFGWSYTSLATPVNVEAGKIYSVSMFFLSSTGASRNELNFQTLWGLSMPNLWFFEGHLSLINGFMGAQGETEFFDRVPAMPDVEYYSDNATQVLYTPNAGYEGLDTIGFTLSDGVMKSDKAEVQINVQTRACEGKPCAIQSFTADPAGNQQNGANVTYTTETDFQLFNTCYQIDIYEDNVNKKTCNQTRFNNQGTPCSFTASGSSQTKTFEAKIYKRWVGNNCDVADNALPLNTVVDTKTISTTWKDTIPPAAPSTPDLAAASDSGKSNTDNVTNDTTPTFTGTAEADSTVKIYSSGTEVGSGIATGGSYGITASALAEGSHSIKATATDVAGNVSVDSGVLAITIDTATPALSQVTPVPTPTNDTTPNYTFSSTEAGTIAYGGDCSSATTSAVAGNNTVTFSALADGAHSNCTVKVTDIAGNASADLNVNSFTIDSVTPTLTRVTSVPSPTNDTTPNYTFNSTEAGTIAYGGDCSSPTTSAVAGNNTVTFATLAEGIHNNCIIIVTDVAGNSSPDLNVNSFRIDITAPVITVFSINGISYSGGVTVFDKDALDIAWTASDNAGGSGIQRHELWRAPDASGSPGTWAVVPGKDNLAPATTSTTDNPAEGTYWYGIHTLDNAGVGNCITETGAHCGGVLSDGQDPRTVRGPIKVVMDKTPPGIPGIPTTTTPTNSTKPTWTWTASTGDPALYTVYWDTIAGGETNSFSVAVNSFTHTAALSEGTWYAKVKAFDAAGNPSAFSGNGTVAVDLTAPVTSVVSVGGDTVLPYWYTKQGGSVDIVIHGETDMKCRYANVDVSYSNVPTPIVWWNNTGECSISGSTATCAIRNFGLGQGTRTRYVSCKDAAGNEQTNAQNLDVAFGVDWAAPAGNIVINSGDSETNSSSVTLTLSCTDAVRCSTMRFSNNGTTFSAEEPFASSKSWALDSATQGTKTVYVKYKDDAENLSSSFSDSIIFDAIAPTVTSVSSTAADGIYTVGASIPITVTFSEAVTVTGTPQLLLETGSTDTVVDYLSGSGGTVLTFQYIVAVGNNSPDLDYASPIIFGAMTIKDAAGNDAGFTLASPGAANSLGANKNIFVDTIAPTVTAFSINGSSCVGAACPVTVFDKDALDIAWTASDNAGGSGIQRHELWRAPDASGSPGTWAVVPGKDNLAPATTSTTDNPAEGTYWYGMHTLDNAGTGNCITETGIHCGGTPSDVNDLRTVRGPIKVIMDKTAPVTSLTSVAGDTSSPYWDTTNNSSTDIVVSGEAGMQCRLKVSDTTYSGAGPSKDCLVSGSTATCSLSSGGTFGTGWTQKYGITFYISCRDAAENEQTVAQNLNAMFGLDWTKPTGSIVINGGAAATNSSTVTLNLSCSDAVSGCSTMQFFNASGGAMISGTLSAEEPFAPSKSWVLYGAAEGNKDVGVQYRDNAGNSSGGAWYDSIKFDATAPTVTAFSINGSSCSGGGCPGTVTADDALDILWTAPDYSGGSGIQKYELWRAPDSGGSPGTWVRVIDNAVSPAIDDPADGTWWYGVHAIDKAGNCITETGAHCGGVLSDGQDPRIVRGPIKVVMQHNAAPDAPSNLDPADNSWFNTAKPAFSFALSDPDTADKVKYSVQISTVSNFASLVVDYVSALAAQGSASFTVGQAVAGGSYAAGNAGQTLADGTVYYWRVKAIDEKGAESAFTAATMRFQIDSAAPVVSAFDVTPGSWTNGDIIVSWIHPGMATGVTDSGGSGLKQIEVWRAWDANGNGTLQPGEWNDNSPLSGTQSNPVSTKTSGFTSSTSDDGSYTDITLTASGTYWYGLHVLDNAGGIGYEPSSKKALVDKDAPTTLIDSPADSWLHRSAQQQSFLKTTDEDLESGLNASGCTLEACSYEPNGTEHCKGMESRTCNVTTNTEEIFVGPGATHCDYQGWGACIIFVGAEDLAGNTAESFQEYNIDWEFPVVGKLYVTPTEAAQTYPIHVQQDVPTTYKVHVTDNVGFSYCNLYIDGLLEQGPIVPTGCTTDCTIEFDGVVLPDPGGDHTYTNNYAVCYDVSAQGSQSTAEDIVVETLTVSLGAVPTSGSVNTLFDFTADTAGSTMTGDTTYGFDCRIDTGDCTADGNFADCDFSITTSATAYTAADLCQYPVTAGTYTAKVAVKRGVGTAQDTVAIGPITTNSDPTTTVRSVDTPNATDYCGVTGFPPVRVRWTFSDADPGDTQGAYELEVFRASDGVKVVDTGKKPGATQEYVFQSAGEQLLWGTSYTWQVKVWDNHDAASAFIAGPGFTTIAHYYPVPNFTWYPIFPSAEELIQFTDQTNFAAGATGKTWSWDFDNSNGIQVDSSLQNPTHTYSQTKAYGVTLQATDNVGSCSTSQTVNVAVPFPEWQEISPF